MDALLGYIKEHGGVVHNNIQQGKVPTDEQLQKFTKETVVKLKELSKNAPDHVRQTIMLPWAPQWDFQKNGPGAGDHKLDPAKLLDIMKRIKDGLTQGAPAKPASAPGGPRKQAPEGGDAPQEEKREPKYTGPETTDAVPIEPSHIGRIVGPKGATLKMIQENSDCKLDVQQDTVTITGPEDGMPVAVQAIKELCEKGFCGLSYGSDFQEQAMNVHPIYFSELIGKDGAVIRAIKDQLKVELSIPKIPPNQKVREMTKKLKVGFAGRKPDVEKAKEVVGDILMYYHHEITHPGEDHAELDVPSWAYSFIIGKAGSELRHIQNNYKVRVHIPREGVSESDKVIIVGEKHNVERCTVYVQKLLSGAEDMSKGRDRQEKSEDPWGDEGPEEEWMKQYMFKR